MFKPITTARNLRKRLTEEFMDKQTNRYPHVVDFFALANGGQTKESRRRKTKDILEHGLIFRFWAMIN